MRLRSARHALRNARDELDRSIIVILAYAAFCAERADGLEHPVKVKLKLTFLIRIAMVEIVGVAGTLLHQC